MPSRCPRSVAVIAAVILLIGCRTAAVPPRAEQPIVVLVSIDGFRWDYLEKFRPPTLLSLARDGVRADGLIPQFPSKTFPNHYTIVTGMRLASHGIISNNMKDPAIPGRFSLRNRDVLADLRWWGGEPIWNTAERQGLAASSLFWPGSEAKVGGEQAKYWMPYDEAMSHDERVAKTIEYLRSGVSFATLYFSDVDTAGHRSGPDSEDVRAAVARVDRALAELVEGVRTVGLAHRVNYVVVSDHGMAELSRDRAILLDDYVDLSTVEIIDWSPVATLEPKDGRTDALFAALHGKHPALTVYRRGDLPARYGLAGHPRLPPVVAIAREGWHITSRSDVERARQQGLGFPGGNHGYDPQVRSMHGLFVAAGPDVRAGLRVPPFENIHVYELLCALLGIDPAPNDGDSAVTRPLLKKGRRATAPAGVSKPGTAEAAETAEKRRG